MRTVGWVASQFLSVVILYPIVARELGQECPSYRKRGRWLLRGLAGHASFVRNHLAGRHEARQAERLHGHIP